MLRVDAAIARLGVRLLNDFRASHKWTGESVKLEEFMPWPRKDEAPASPEEVMALLSSLVKKKA